MVGSFRDLDGSKRYADGAEAHGDIDAQGAFVNGFEGMRRRNAQAHEGAGLDGMAEAFGFVGFDHVAFHAAEGGG